jgi:uncharacterized protein (UPF0264 family)
MLLLVSVRSDAEVEAAVAGGADIIDAKEPDRGSLGPVSRETFRIIAEQVPAHLPLSAALGDFADAETAHAAVTEFPVVTRPAPLYLKLGFAGVSSARRIREVLEAARLAAQGRSPPAPAIIAVAYGDCDRAGTASPEQVCHAAAAAGAGGLLLDTQAKGDTNLLDWVDPARLTGLVERARAAGLMTAVAGGLGAEHLRLVRQCRPDIVGFRGAVCTGGRAGWISRSKVARLSTLMAAGSAFLRGLDSLEQSVIGETPEDPAIPFR